MDARRITASTLGKYGSPTPTNVPRACEDHGCSPRGKVRDDIGAIHDEATRHHELSTTGRVVASCEAAATRPRFHRRIDSWFVASPLFAFGALGAAAEDLLAARRFVFGGAAEISDDPRNGPGGGARARARLTPGYLRGLYLDLRVKSQGYWVAQPATPGPHLARHKRVKLRFQRRRSLPPPHF